MKKDDSVFDFFAGAYNLGKNMDDLLRSRLVLFGIPYRFGSLGRLLISTPSLSCSLGRGSAEDITFAICVISVSKSRYLYRSGFLAVVRSRRAISLSGSRCNRLLISSDSIPSFRAREANSNSTFSLTCLPPGMASFGLKSAGISTYSRMASQAAEEGREELDGIPLQGRLRFIPQKRAKGYTGRG